MNRYAVELTDTAFAAITEQTRHIDKRTVWIIGLRHGHRLPLPSDLPPDFSALEDVEDSED